MKKEVLIKRLEIYKKEIYRRAYIIMFAVFLPIILAFIGMGIWGDIMQYGVWAIVMFLGAFAIAIFAIILWFVYMINKSLPKKIGLLCPNCNVSIISNTVENFVRTGVCSHCGEKILED